MEGGENGWDSFNINFSKTKKTEQLKDNRWRTK